MSWKPAINTPPRCRWRAMFATTGASVPGVRKIITLIGDAPVDIRRLASRGSEHVGIDIDADDVDAATPEFASDAARAAAGIEHRCGREALDEVCFAVHVLAGGGAIFVGCVVRVAGDVTGFEPAVRWVRGHAESYAERDQRASRRLVRIVRLDRV